LQTVNGDLNRYIREFWILGDKWGLNNPEKPD
jgi:hypothetical protein